AGRRARPAGRRGAPGRSPDGPRDRARRRGPGGDRRSSAGARRDRHRRRRHRSAAADPRRGLPRSHRGAGRRVGRPRRPHPPRTRPCGHRPLRSRPRLLGDSVTTMTTTTFPTTTGAPPAILAPERPAGAVATAAAIAGRTIRKFVRTPQLLVVNTISGAMFLLIFRYVFGGAIDTGPLPYVDFLVPGYVVTSILFAGSTA